MYGFVSGSADVRVKRLLADSTRSIACTSGTWSIFIFIISSTSASFSDMTT